MVTGRTANGHTAPLVGCIYFNIAMFAEETHLLCLRFELSGLLGLPGQVSSIEGLGCIVNVLEDRSTLRGTEHRLSGFEPC